MDEMETTEPFELVPEQLAEVDDILGDYDGPIELLDWHGHKLAVLDAARINTEFLNKIENRRKDNRSVIIVVVGEPGEGKSLHEDEKVIILDKNDLMFVPIKNVKYSSGMKTLCVSSNNFGVSFQNILNITKHKENRNLVKIITKSGRHVRATIDHSFLVLNDIGKLSKKKGGELKIGDFLPTIFNYKVEDFINEIDLRDYLDVEQYENGLFDLKPKSKMANNYYFAPKKLSLSWELGFILGAYLAEGCYTKTRMIKISNSDPHYIETLKKCVKTVLKQKLREYTRIDTEVVTLDLHNMVFNYFVSNVCGIGSENKKVPSFSYLAPKHFRKGLLDGYLSGDGCLHSNSNTCIEFSYTSKSKELVQGVSLLLSSFGIPVIHRARKGHKQYKNNIYYIGSIKPIDIKKYWNEIGFHSKNKNDTYSTKIKPRLAKQKNFLEVFKTVPINKFELQEYGKLNNFSKRDAPSRKIFNGRLANEKTIKGFNALKNALIDLKPYEKIKTNYISQLEKILDGDVFLDKIIKIEQIQYNGFVYDLSISTHENFALANGLIVHNSWLAMRFAQLFDKNFDVLDPDESPEPGKDPSQVIFERTNFFYLIGKDTPLKYGQVIMPDEAQYAAGSRRWYEELQIDLMEQVESVRSMGFIIVIVALHLALLDKIIRKFVLTYMFRVNERGKAIVYRLYTPTFGDKMHQKRLGVMYLQMPDIEYCSSNKCLRCEYLRAEEDERCMTIRAKYERKKRDFLDRRNLEAQKKEEIKKARKYTVQEDAEHAEEQPELYRWNEQGRLMPECIRLILEKDREGYHPSERRIKAVRDRLEIQHPELRKERGWDKEKS